MNHFLGQNPVPFKMDNQLGQIPVIVVFNMI